MRRTRVLVTLLASALTVLALPSQANASLAVRYRHFHFNMCGAACALGYYYAADAVVDSISDYRPHIVTLNEVCYSQYIDIAVRTGYLARFTMTSPDDAKCTIGTDRRYGNAILITPVSSIIYETRVHDLWPPAPVEGSNEVRRLTCLATTISGGHLYVCNTHIHPGTYREDQIQEVATIMNGVYGPTGKGIVLAGDFNVNVRACSTEQGAYIDVLYRSAYGGTGTNPCYTGVSTFSEVDRWRSNGSHGDINERTHPGSGGKLDYIFFNHTHFAVDWWGDATSTTYSDHVPLRGEYTLLQ